MITTRTFQNRPMHIWTIGTDVFEFTENVIDRYVAEIISGTTEKLGNFKM